MPVFPTTTTTTTTKKKNYQHKDGLRFYIHEPMPINQDLREVSEAEITPNQTGHVGYQMINRDNDMIPSPCKIIDHEKTIIPVIPANPGRNAGGQISGNMSPKLINLYNVPATSIFKTGDKSIKAVERTNAWNIDKEIISQICKQSKLPKIKSENKRGKVSASKKSQKMDTQKVKETVSSKSSASKPIILKSADKTPM
jgi:hypothetical protein